ncbi:MAG TPA: hypothetical protein VF444_11275 [Pseudonocardiaceae bacterium]
MTSPNPQPSSPSPPASPASPSLPAGLAHARRIADAVLYEGYVLYPYRASAVKNAGMRFQWGVLMPPAVAADGTGERSGTRAELLAEPRGDADLRIWLRFLQVQRRTVEVDGEPVGTLTVAGTDYSTWDEAVEREVCATIPVADLYGAEHVVPFGLPGGEEFEPIPGRPDARLRRRRVPMSGEMSVRMDPLPGPYGGVRLRLDTRNTSTWDDPGAGRDDALPHALIAAHSLLTLTDGRFLSLVDPPEWAAPAAADCHNDGVWPVLAGEPGEADVMLCSPIILYDHPEIAAQSAGDLFDGTEIDELLTLRTMTLTDEEKREARATDPRAAELIDRIDGLPPELLDRLHGTIRYLRSATAPAASGTRAAENAAPRRLEGDVPWWDPGADASVSPETDMTYVQGVPVRAGSRVRLHPGKRADAHDMFLAGRTAIVQAVLLDVDGDTHLAITLEDDPGAELYAQHGRYRYFGPDEVEPLDGGAP